MCTFKAIYEVDLYKSTKHKTDFERKLVKIYAFAVHYSLDCASNEIVLGLIAYTRFFQDHTSNSSNAHVTRYSICAAT